jgi:hypothetical protein
VPANVTVPPSSSIDRRHHPASALSRQELELGFVFLGGEDEVGGEFVAAFGNEILDQGGFALGE